MAINTENETSFSVLIAFLCFFNLAKLFITWIYNRHITQSWGSPGVWFHPNFLPSISPTGSLFSPSPFPVSGLIKREWKESNGLGFYCHAQCSVTPSGTTHLLLGGGGKRISFRVFCPVLLQRPGFRWWPMNPSFVPILDEDVISLGLCFPSSREAIHGSLFFLTTQELMTALHIQLYSPASSVLFFSSPSPFPSFQFWFRSAQYSLAAKEVDVLQGSRL